jgi:hypothetical protein
MEVDGRRTGLGRGDDFLRQAHVRTSTPALAAA